MLKISAAERTIWLGFIQCFANSVAQFPLAIIVNILQITAYTPQTFWEMLHSTTLPFVQ